MKKVLVLFVMLMMVTGFAFARGGPDENPGKGPADQGNENQRATENVPDHAEADLPLGFNCGDDITFTYNEEEVAYGTIKSPNTGRCWMDRNLGASRKATSYDDKKAYGDLFQWGRSDDGHQNRDSETTSEQATDSKVEHGKFITGYRNWLNYEDDSLWEKDSPNNPCPEGWRVPAIEEWIEERDKGRWNRLSDGYSDLYLTGGGLQRYKDDFVTRESGRYWSTDVASWIFSPLFMPPFWSSEEYRVGTAPAHGLSVRCLKN